MRAPEAMLVLIVTMTAADTQVAGSLNLLQSLVTMTKSQEMRIFMRKAKVKQVTISWKQFWNLLSFSSLNVITNMKIILHIVHKLTRSTKFNSYARVVTNAIQVNLVQGAHE